MKIEVWPVERPQAVDKVAASMQAFGFCQPKIAHLEDGRTFAELETVRQTKRVASAE